MANYIDMYTKSQKIKIWGWGLYGKGNEIISWCSFCVGSCLIFSGNYCCMQCCHWNTLHQICMSRINNDNVHQGLKVIFDDDNVHLSSCMPGKRWETFFYMWTPFSNMIVIMISQCISWAAMHSLLHEQRNKWIPKSSMAWPHWHHERCATVRCGIPRHICSVVRKWVENEPNEGAL
jgi:hypothetical protein